MIVSYDVFLKKRTASGKSKRCDEKQIEADWCRPRGMRGLRCRRLCRSAGNKGEGGLVAVGVVCSFWRMAKMCVKYEGKRSVQYTSHVTFGVNLRRHAVYPEGTTLYSMDVVGRQGCATVRHTCVRNGIGTILDCTVVFSAVALYCTVL